MRRLKRAARVIPVCTALIFALAGCWDKVELENRGFVTALGLDARPGDKEKTFELSMAMPDVAAMVEKKDDEKAKSVKTESDRTVTAAMHKVDASTSRRVYFGQAKTVIFSASLLADEKLFKEALDALDRNSEISGKLLVLATSGSALEVLSSKPADEPAAGIFISNYYKSNLRAGTAALKQELGTLIERLNSTGSAVIPEIEVEDDAFKIEGAMLINNGKLAGTLNAAQTRGYLWVKGKTKGTQVTAMDASEGAQIPVTITDAHAKTEIKDENGRLTAHITVTAKGIVEEYLLGGVIDEDLLRTLEKNSSGAIRIEIEDAFSMFQNAGADGFDFKETLRKLYYESYLKYKDNWDEALKGIRLSSEISVKITNTGALR